MLRICSKNYNAKVSDERIMIWSTLMSLMNLNRRTDRGGQSFL